MADKNDDLAEDGTIHALRPHKFSLVVLHNPARDEIKPIWAHKYGRSQ
jgi:hypothetical protein